MLASVSRLILLTLGLALGVACDDKKDAAAGDAVAKPDAAKADDEDKGSATLALGEERVEWKAERARARIKDNGTLTISASVGHSNAGKIERRSLTLSVPDFKGPGKYTIDNVNSHLAGVSINLDELDKANATDDKAAADKAALKATTDALGNSSIVMLEGATVEVTKVTDDFIDGTVVWAGIVAIRGPKQLSGEFHALIKKD